MEELTLDWLKKSRALTCYMFLLFPMLVISEICTFTNTDKIFP